MSNRQKPYYGKDHIHQPEQGKGAYRRDHDKRLTAEEVNHILEEGLDDLGKASRPYGNLDTYED